MLEIEVGIEKVVFPGKGLGRRDGQVVFVPGALAGERVRARVVRTHKRHIDAELTEVLSPSAERCAPDCALALGCRAAPDACPGCVYRHVPYPAEVEIKQAQLREFLAYAVGGRDVPLLPPVPSPRSDGYRNKIVLHADGNGALGYFAADNRSVLDVPQCPLACAEINGAIGIARHDVAGLRMHESITFRFTPTDGVHTWSSRTPPAPGERVTESGSFGILRVPTMGFFQVNIGVAEQVADEVRRTVCEAGTRRVIDLFCGCGLFGLHVAPFVERVTGIEIDAEAIRAAKANAAERGLANCGFEALPADQWLHRWKVGGGSLADALVLLDPPRAGLAPGILRKITESGARQVAYISCAPDKLARDIRGFREAGFELQSARLFDMFPRTPYFETLVVLRSHD